MHQSFCNKNEYLALQPHTLQSRASRHPAKINAKLQAIISVNKSSKGVWDILLWKDGQLKFVELKRIKKDAIRQTQIQFLESALECGYKSEQFEVLE